MTICLDFLFDIFSFRIWEICKKLAKGDLISERFSLWLKSPVEASSIFEDSAHGREMAPSFGNLSQREKLSYINVPLLKFWQFQNESMKSSFLPKFFDRILGDMMTS